MKFLTTDLEKIKWLRHGFFTRIGGMSEGVYEGLNCAFSSQDKPDHIRANRAKIAETLDLEPENIITLKQIHSAKVIVVTKPFGKNQPPEADAMVTATNGLGISVLTADCAPVLFASRKEKVIGAAHAGWKGAIGGVMEATIAEMEKLGAKKENIVAAIGPCIGPQSYEVGTDFQTPFLAQDADNAQFFKAAVKEGHLIFDLPGYVAHRLTRAGVSVVYDTKQDTLPNEQAYFSYRRACQRGEADYGRQLSIIALR